MNFTIFINDKPLILLPEHENPPSEIKEANSFLRHKYTGQRISLYEYIEKLEHDKDVQGIIIYSNDLKSLWKDFKSLYKIIDAAGGIVYEETGNVLLIFRLKHWDFPKGKIDAGESPKEAAIREVMEETGLKNVSIQKHFMDTYHTYREGKNRILKKTYWFTMYSPDKALTLQQEEYIDAAVWVDVSDFLNQNPKPIYASIRLLLNALMQPEPEKK